MTGHLICYGAQQSGLYSEFLIGGLHVQRQLGHDCSRLCRAGAIPGDSRYNFGVTDS
jgi:hypothetical protein